MFTRSLARFALLVAIQSTFFSNLAHAQPSGGSGPRICVLLDHSASMIHFAVDLPTLDELRALQQLIARKGGSIGYGIIQENPSKSLLRMSVPPPELGLAPPTQSTNVFSRAKLERAYERERPAQEARERDREAMADQQVIGFETELETLLTSGAGEATSSDLFGNLRRCSAFLMEPSPERSPDPDRYMLLVSDGRHNLEQSKFEPVDRSIKVLSVSGAIGLGDTAQIGRRVLWFEGVRGAINYLIATAEAN